jgi:hypothetical protein
VIESGRFDEPYEFEAALGGPYIASGQPERWVELCRTMIARNPSRHTYTRACLVLALAITGADREAIAASESVRAAAEATDNPGVLAWALFAYGFAHLDADPAGAYEALRRGLTIARESGNRLFESLLASSASRLAATHGDPMDALEYLTLAVRFLYRPTSIGSDTTNPPLPFAASPLTPSRRRPASR